MRELVASLLLVFVFGCDGASRATVEGDGAQKPRDARADLSNKDAGVDLNIKPPPVPNTVEQAPITFIVTNKANKPRYVRWNSPFTELLLFEQLSASGAKPVRFVKPFCMASCSELNSRDECLCIGCAMPAPSMKLLAPGDSTQVIWSGKRYLTEDYCECGCWSEVDPKPGRYKVLVDAFASVKCVNSPCPPPNADNVIPMAEPEGDALTSSVEFVVATKNTRIEIWLE